MYIKNVNGVGKMKIQETANGAAFIYLTKADVIELGWKKGDSLRACVIDNTMRLQKRGVYRERT